MVDQSKILVAEDNDFVRMQIVKFLSDAGHEVVEAADGAQALERIKDDFGAAIVDVRMEPINGFEFIRTLRSRNMKTPVILVTGDQNPDLLSESSKWEVAAVLMKPVQKDRLIKVVERALKTRKVKG